ncbi:MAG: hypothetical protein V2A56_02725 [bacterium]
MIDFNSPDFKKNHAVRLFPSVSKISDERRATEALLSMIMAVSEFGKEFLGACKAPKTRVACYAEIPFSEKDGINKFTPRPDGAIVSKRGQEWKALVEVKIGKNIIEQEQFDVYKNIANTYKYNALITVSNQPADENGGPSSVKYRSNSKLRNYHFSWERLLSMARMIADKVKDEDQKYMLNEWIRFVHDENSGIIVPSGLGPHWSDLLNAAKNDALSSSEKVIEDVLKHWDYFLKRTAFVLSGDMEANVKLVETGDPKKGNKTLVKKVKADQKLAGEYKIPNTAGNIWIEFNLKTRDVCYTMPIKPPKDGSQGSRISELKKQLKKTTPEWHKNVTIFVDWPYRKPSTYATIDKVIEDWKILLELENGEKIDKKIYPTLFRLVWRRKIRKGRGVEVLSEIQSDIQNFYGHICEHIAFFPKKAPQIDELVIENEEKEAVENAVGPK